MSAESTAALQQGFRLTGWTVGELWLAAAGIGGALDRRDIEGITSGRRGATPVEHDIIAAALNDYFVDHGHNHPVAFWRELRGGG